MAERLSAESRWRRRVFRPQVAFSAVAIGAVTASVGVAGANAAPDYPTWEDVQDAKADEAATRAEIAAIDALLTGLETTAADAGRRQQIADEQYRIAKVALEEELAEAAADAEQRASISKMRAGLIAAHLSRTSGGDLGLGLALDSDGSRLLDQLTAMGKLSEQTRTIYDEALTDRNLAASLGEQAEAARGEREKLAAEAEKALTAAGDAAAAAQAAFAEQQARQGELYEQLALLKDSTAEAEAAYRQSRVTPPSAGGTTAPGAPPAAGPAPAIPAPGNSAPSGPAPVTPAPANPAPSNPTPSNPAPSNPAPSTPAPSTPAPSPSATAGAIAFARAQIGDRYRLAGYGPDEWDCSGLTKAAYASVGIYIGTHSATNQYNYAAARGQLVPYSERQPGDLIFYSSGGGDMYHVTLYTGGGMMVEAPYAGVPVREVPVRNGDRVAYVARPSA